MSEPRDPARLRALADRLDAFGWFDREFRREVPRVVPIGCNLERLRRDGDVTVGDIRDIASLLRALAEEQEKKVSQNEALRQLVDEAQELGIYTYDVEPEWADVEAIGVCSRGHAERQPQCPACHDMRIAAWESGRKP